MRGTRRGRRRVPEVLTLGEAARYLSVSESWLHTVFREGRGPDHVKFGTEYRILYADILSWLEKMKTRTTKVTQGGVKRATRGQTRRNGEKRSPRYSGDGTYLQ